MTKQSEFIHGVCQQWLFSPKGFIEGALVKMKGRVVQISAPLDQGAALAESTVPGRATASPGGGRPLAEDRGGSACGLHVRIARRCGRPGH